VKSNGVDERVDAIRASWAISSHKFFFASRGRALVTRAHVACGVWIERRLRRAKRGASKYEGLEPPAPMRTLKQTPRTRLRALPSFTGKTRN
jgi:hypothetical protein